MKNFKLLNTSGIAIGTATITGGNSIGLQLAGGKAIQVTNVAALTDITTPATGMVVYQTSDNTLYMYQGTVWTGLSVNSLADGQVRIGSNLNIATPRTISGDITLSNTGVTLIQNNAVTTAKVADGAITTAKIADANVTAGKLATPANSKVLATSATGANEWTSLVRKISISGNTTLTAAQLTPGRIVMFQNSNTDVGGTNVTITVPAQYKFTNRITGNQDRVYSIPGGGNVTVYIAETPTAAPDNLYMVDIVGAVGGSTSTSTTPGWALGRLVSGTHYNPPTNTPMALEVSGTLTSAFIEKPAGTVILLEAGKTYLLEASMPSWRENEDIDYFSYQFFVSPSDNVLKVNPTTPIGFAGVSIRANPAMTTPPCIAMAIYTVPQVYGNRYCALKCTSAGAPIDETTAYVRILELK